jgi:hypothetical protein
LRRRPPVLSDGNKVATITITAASTASESLADGWRISYVATVDGETSTSSANEAMLIRAALWPVCHGCLDSVQAGEQSLDPSGLDADHRAERRIRTYRDEAWIEIQQQH